MKIRLSNPSAIGRPLQGKDGAVLVMSLLLLAMITILGLYSSMRTATEEKIAGANVTATKVFYVAEAALSHARKLLNDAYADDPANQDPATAPNWNFALDGSVWSPQAANIYCSTGCTDSAGLLAGGWVNGGVTVLEEAKTIGGIDYTYVVYIYDNNDAGGLDQAGNTCAVAGNEAIFDCDGIILVRAIARSWKGTHMLGESVQEESLGTRIVPRETTGDTTGGQAGPGGGKTGTTDDRDAVDMTGGGQVM